MELSDKKWAISSTGYSIKEDGYGKIIFHYPGEYAPINEKNFEKWLEAAESICEIHNSKL